MDAWIRKQYMHLWDRLKRSSYKKACDEFAFHVGEEWCDRYRAMPGPGRRDIRIIDLDPTYVYDDVPVGQGRAEERLVAVYGYSKPQNTPRDSAYMRKFPLKHDHFRPLDRGHAASHGQGGSEQGINLFPQRRDVNQGRSVEGFSSSVRVRRHRAQ